MDDPAPARPRGTRWASAALPSIPTELGFSHE